MACNSIAPVHGCGNSNPAGHTTYSQQSGGNVNQGAIQQHAADNNIPEDELVSALTDLQNALSRKPPNAGEIKKVVAELATLFGISGVESSTPVKQASGAKASARGMEDAFRALGIPPDIIDRIVSDQQNMAPQIAPHMSFLQGTPGNTPGEATPVAGSVGNTDSGGDGNTDDAVKYAALKQHVDGILADGRNHGFPERFKSYVPRIWEAMQHLKQAGIVTANDAITAIKQTAKWLMSNAGSDGVFSFGGGPANEDDAKVLSDKSGISREDINAAKFMFDDFHDAELSQKDSFLTVDPNNPVFQDLAGVLSRNGLFEHR